MKRMKSSCSAPENELEGFGSWFSLLSTVLNLSQTSVGQAEVMVPGSSWTEPGEGTASHLNMFL